MSSDFGGFASLENVILYHTQKMSHISDCDTSITSFHLNL